MDRAQKECLQNVSFELSSFNSTGIVTGIPGATHHHVNEMFWAKLYGYLCLAPVVKHLSCCTSVQSEHRNSEEQKK